MRSIASALATSLLALVLTACDASQDGPARLDNYLSRLSGALDAPIPEQRPLPIARISAADLEQQAVTRSNIDVLDFLSLSGCALQVNLGRRNSSLGRTASPSQRLLLDLEFLDLAPACIAKMRADDKAQLAEQLSTMAVNRRLELPISIYNAVLAGPEFQQFWQVPSTLGDYPARTNSEIVDVLSRLDTLTKDWLAGQYRTDNSEFERLLAALRSGDGGALLRAANTQTAMLARGDSLLRASKSERPLCGPVLISPKVDIIRNVIRRFFAEDVQRWLADIAKRQHVLMPPITALESRLDPVLPQRYRAWQAERTAQLADIGYASRRHVAAIQALLHDCPGMPDA